ncbi:alpha-amylase family glycosyl hydrolase [Marinilabilia rubra]|uniref:Glycosyl hydrolase family 13 catalytic domain-containing protein n=1 Tax=Marinilabilia rubra TaxID=2162893 RepID=A0A2U2BBZ5_9BACT|nr:alpha-amylase family glycosyl hydrolase [Marinilabilia rubra]PWE00589.1 hypothetical protein DDZ16_03040 [Marinilabilia rubra]
MRKFFPFILLVLAFLFGYEIQSSAQQETFKDEDRGATDFVFGNNELSEHIVAKRIQDLSGIFHNHRIEPRDPNIGQEVIVTVTVGDEVDPENAWCYYTTDGTNPKGLNGIAENGIAVPLKQTSVVWEDLIWGYITEFKAVIPAQTHSCVVRYIIEVGNQFAKGTEGSYGSSKTHPYFAYAVDDWSIPDWAYDAVMYYVLPDRFNPGKGKSWVQTSNLEEPMGGTLNGIREKLDHLENIGVNVLWLMPFTSGPTYHKYGADDFYAIDPDFGSEQDLKDLINDAHSRGMKVLVDFVANHCSDHHPYFLEAMADSTSKYRDWFDIHEDGTYESFFGGGELPHLVNENPEVRKYIFELGEHLITNLGLDGFDLDYAIGPSHEFWTEFGYAMRSLGKEIVIFTEGVTTPESLLSYAGRVDGCQDFAFCQAVRKAFAYGKMNVEEFERFLKGSESYFPNGFLTPIMIDNHNMDRFLFVSNEEVNRLKLASAVMYSMSRPFSIWAGTELGMSQDVSCAKSTLSASRHATDWENINEEVLDYFIKLAKIRSEHKAMARGTRIPILADAGTGILAYEKRFEEDTIVVVINNGTQSHKIELQQAFGMQDLLNDISVNSEEGTGVFEIQGKTAVYLAN